MPEFRAISGVLLALLGAVLYSAATHELSVSPRIATALEMQVALPRFVQVAMSGGDRFLAANVAGFRALVASTEKMDAASFHIQGIVQSDAAWLNPAHEDNYYIAAAILPWNGELSSGQYVLRRAALARPFDWQPAFYYAFNELHFNKNPALASEWVRRAAQSATNEMEKLQLWQLAAQWAAKGEDLGAAIRLHRVMAKESKHKAFAEFLEKRARRLENLLELDQAAAAYKAQHGKKPASVNELLSAGGLREVPLDPFGMTYVFGRNEKAEVSPTVQEASGKAERNAK